MSSSPQEKSQSAAGCPFHASGSGDLPAYSFTRTDPFGPPDQVKSLRESGRLSKVKLWNGNETWVATHYQDVREILGDSRFSTQLHRDGYPFVTAVRESMLRKGRPNFTFMDPPDHTKFRRTLAPLFTLGRIAKLRPFIEATTEEVLAGMALKAQPLDFVKEVAHTIPLRVLSAFVGLPQEGFEVYFAAGRSRVDLAGDKDKILATGEALWTYLERLFEAREKSPVEGDEIVNRLVIDHINTGKITRHDAVLIVNQLLLAGLDTTVNMIAMGTLALLKDPEQYALLCADPGLVERAIEEMLRFATVLHFHSPRTAKEDVEIAGQVIRSGDGVMALLHGANRDPAEFPNPDKFDIGRDAAHHVAFSYGIHQCLGQPLARLELKIVFSALIQKFPKLRLAQPISEIKFSDLGLAYGPLGYLVSW